MYLFVVFHLFYWNSSLFSLAYFGILCQYRMHIPAEHPWILCSSSLSLQCWDYCDVIMGAVASQITSLRIVYSTFYSDQWCQAACKISKRLEYFTKLHTVVRLWKICRKFISRKTDHSRCKYGLPFPFMGRIWWPGDRLQTALLKSAISTVGAHDLNDKLGLCAILITAVLHSITTVLRTLLHTALQC